MLAECFFRCFILTFEFPIHSIDDNSSHGVAKEALYTQARCAWAHTHSHRRQTSECISRYGTILTLLFSLNSLLADNRECAPLQLDSFIRLIRYSMIVLTCNIARRRQ
ncbi:hypothetical protein TNIN_408751 [Trichonephila inaurata madagascariensis]|uniref:Uncharacterized protein n=1 Tax=Trichonephila inaurata madagascariensis TaxID=2747483 RepID=A0A8X7BRM7_9ARAC|nr:hypothetical protein TNIN_408751 [Trichonephila inaurata madagascariensis]